VDLSYSLLYNKLYDKQEVLQQVGQLVAQQIRNKFTANRSNEVTEVNEVTYTHARAAELGAERMALAAGRCYKTRIADHR